MAWVELCFDVEDANGDGDRECHKVWIPDKIRPDWPWEDFTVELDNPRPVPWIVFGSPHPVPWRELLGLSEDVKVNPKPWKFAETELVERIDGARLGSDLRDLGAALHVLRAASTIANDELRERLVTTAIEVANVAASLSLPGGEVHAAG